MSEKNRKKEYLRLVKAGKLSQDDGALIKEFGQPPNAKEPFKEPAKKGKK